MFGVISQSVFSIQISLKRGFVVFRAVGPTLLT